jgi:RNA polymerase sigma-70 factor (ECF subfamily)
MNEERGRWSIDHRSMSTDAKQREFLALLEPALASLNRFASAMCRDSNIRDDERARDLVSETILRAYEQFDRLRDDRAFLSYLFTIAVRLNRDDRQKRSRWRTIEDSDRERVDSNASPETNADVSLLYDAIAKLPKKYREAVVMNEIVGLTLAEVAEIEGVSLSAMKSRVSRGRKKLAKMLGVTDQPEADIRSSVATNGSGNFHARFAFQGKEKL